MSQVETVRTGFVRVREDTGGARAREAELWDWHQTNQPTAAATQARQQVIDHLRAHLLHLDRNSNLRLAPFGSAVTGLGSADSDVDLCLLDPAFPRGFPAGTLPHRTGLYSMSRIAQWLRMLPGVRVTHVVRHAKVPIVKFEVTVGGGRVIQADINTNNRLGVYNSRLIKSYCTISPIARPLIMLVKYWAKRRSLNDPSGSTTGAISFSSYSLTLLVLVYLQTRAILPNLQHLHTIHQMHVVGDTFTLDSVQSDTRFVDAPGRFVSRTGPGETPLLSLLVDFFDWVANFDTTYSMVNISKRGVSFKSGHVHASRWQNDAIVILDPFQLDRNTARNVKPFVLNAFMRECRRAADMLRNNTEWAEICRECVWG